MGDATDDGPVGPEDAISLLSNPEQQPSLSEVLEDEPAAIGPHVVLYEQQLGHEDLQPCLRQGDWQRALEVLTVMVQNGQAVATGVDTELDPLDIERAHPELVVLLRGQAFSDLMGKGFAKRAATYYDQHIRSVYPDGKAGNEFVDALLADLQMKAAPAQPQATEPPSHEEDHFGDANKTRQSVNDYLRIYFPAFGHVEVGKKQVGLFGEKQENGVRCLACHRVFRGYNRAKLRFHQLKDATGRQALCAASSEYIRQQLQAEQDGGGGGSSQGAAGTEEAALPLPPSTEAGQGASTSTPSTESLPAPPPPDVRQGPSSDGLVRNDGDEAGAAGPADTPGACGTSSTE